jgi:hypothetical protein
MPPAAKNEVIAELAVHLEETYEEARSNGVHHRAAIKIALQEIPEASGWQVVAADICRAKQENAMNHRTKTVWLPGITILFAVGLFLVFQDRAAYLQRFIWIACMAMLLGAGASEANRLHQRTRSLWLPGFVSMTAAAVFLFAADVVSDPFLFFRQISLHPQDLLVNSESPRLFYFVWLFAQVVFGALGALFSRRAGGTRTARIFAGALPAIILLGTYVALTPITSMFSGRATTSPLPAYVASALCVWVAAPAVALLLGAAPFIRESNQNEIAQSC